MKDNMKDNILNTGGDPPATEGVDFSKMPDEELMKMDISDIFLEDLDRFLQRKKCASAGVREWKPGRRN